MFTTVSTQLSTTTLLRLIDYQRGLGGSQDISEAINASLEFWLDAKNGEAHGADPTSVRGYQWKSLFLPEGTVLRSWSYGEHNFARVEGNKIIHEGRSVSPNQFARYFARTARNAWTDLSVRRPGDKQFRMAHLLRKELAQQQLNQHRAPPLDASVVVVAGPAPCLQPPQQPRPAPPASTPVPAQIPVQPDRTQPVHKSDFDPGWDLPERRKFRYRLEDIAY